MAITTSADFIVARAVKQSRNTKSQIEINISLREFVSQAVCAPQCALRARTVPMAHRSSSRVQRPSRDQDTPARAGVTGPPHAVFQRISRVLASHIGQFRPYLSSTTEKPPRERNCRHEQHFPNPGISAATWATRSRPGAREPPGFNADVRLHPARAQNAQNELLLTAMGNSTRRDRHFRVRRPVVIVGGQHLAVSESSLENSVI